ncbi:TIGR03086 family metal-binding protein [Lipingzhangella sp. LS1_29]|uniref:TIGR03086 family metal-binding protein n=1 Tax=Lipingzhangella rawalii TaxID=2055835 RepID=A0ABU2HAK4_9ACTN|nr:TIGR03086 family metal-binding protein [Lipingzhangella rawalii]MDS1272308.1 TIGR03086 family metal-binding protein [Lipingzhangella rawalii]
MAEVLDLHASALAEFDVRVRAIEPDQWHAPTPCREWDVSDLVGHLVAEQRWVPYLLDGATIPEAEAALATEPPFADLLTAWQVSAGAARTSWLTTEVLDRTVHLSYGETSARHYLWEMTADLTVHAWDLARGIEVDEDLDPELVEAVLEWSLPRVEDLAASGLFDPPIPVSADADAQVRLLALYGRKV